MKKLVIFLSAVFLFFAAGCGESSSSEGSTEDKVITVGAVPDGYPHTFKEDEEFKGFVVDVFNAIFKDMGYEVEWVITDWNGVLANLQSGKVDTAINFAATEERAKTYNFTDPYYSSKAVIATAKDGANIQSLDDLEGKKLASIMGTNFENVLKENYPEENYELVIYESVDVVYTDVATGKVDGFIYGREQLMAQISERDIPLQIVDEPFGDQPVALPFQKTEENDALISEINQTIEKLKENGTFSEISLKWFDIDLLEE
ncbi:MULTISPECIES: transporter substrate-binding domain-containing protein [Oceanobacillus]|uniref:transporter substrate-binding domain-containing protein n=1 Tax=Oceanobacillus TaxID=182709 RepID=UPI00203C8A93|nr:transporter substrate-binding domain-containing protein [Oceanobacillus profundus]MCM3397624.1 transporter substrate-binding domain-containing protein [Oceanobacillus profundus]